MEILKSNITSILTNEAQIDWLIIHKISKAVNNIDGVEFSFVDGAERIDESFKTNQGYICIKNTTALTLFEKTISELSANFISNYPALANLYIIISRVSHTREEKETLIQSFKKNIGKDNCETIYNLLIESLNKEYYKHNHLKEISPQNTNDWLDLFHSTQYLHPISDPLLASLQLVRTERNRELDFELIEKMKPLLRSVLIGQYGLDLIITTSKLKIIYTNENELLFLSACLIDDSVSNKVSPVWLTQNLINIFIEKHWINIGKYMFVHVFGLSYRNKNKNILYENLENLIHNNLIIQIKASHTHTTEWLNNLSFPNDFTALFSWFTIKKIDYQEIFNENKKTILNQFIKELKRISEELPIHLASQNSSDPFNSFQLHETKYQDALAYLLLFILDSNSDNLQEINKICYDFKPLFYGGFRANSLAKHFAEIMLLVAFSGHRIIGINEAMILTLKKYLKILAETILIPYFHLSERDNEIWNLENEDQVFEFSAGKLILNNAIASVCENTVVENYKDFFNEIDNIKIAKWPFERVST